MRTWHPGLDGSTVGGPGFVTERMRRIEVPPVDDVVMTFDSAGDFTEYVRDDDYGVDLDTPQIWAAIVFNKGSPAWDFSVRTNHTDSPRTFINVDRLQRDVNLDPMREYTSMSPRFEDDDYSEEDRRINDLPMPGFSTLQLEVERFIVQQRVDVPFDFEAASESLLTPFFVQVGLSEDDIQAEVAALQADEQRRNQVFGGLMEFFGSSFFAPQRVSFIPFPIKGFEKNNFYTTVADIVPLFFILSLLYPVAQLIRSIVGEKESRIREGMKAMGLGEGALISSWILTYFAIFLFDALVICLITMRNIFQASNFFAVFLLFFLFGTALTTLCWLISTFFSRAKTASIVGLVLVLGLYFPSQAVDGEGSSEAERRAASLCAPTAFALTLEQLNRFEDNGIGVNFSNMNDLQRNWRFATGIWMLLIDTVFYGILAWYLENALPSAFREFGVGRPWYFPFTAAYWREVFGMPPVPTHHSEDGLDGTELSSLHHGSRQNASGSERTASYGAASTTHKDDSLFERVHGELLALERQDRCLAVKGLTKQFGDKVAVNHVDMTMYEGQIFCLLGHNGAGKSTTIAMLTGLLSPTSGTATVYGHDIRSQLNEIRKNLGVCPQHDVLWPDLTVKEHLKLFAGIKGVPAEEVESAIETTVADLGVTEKLHVQSKALSGGQKRKLSVGIALLGGSKVVVLDEPTSGMDPYSRRSTWECLRSARQGRVMLLTTHFMDEADLLGDRIAIMAHGDVRCCGSPFFLKQKYGIGYQLSIVKRGEDRSRGIHGCDEQLLIDTVQQAIPEADMSSNVGSELIFRLPITSSSRFPALFHELDDDLAKSPAQQRFRIETYGVSVTTMEDVFLKVAEGDEALLPGGSQTLQDGTASENGGRPKSDNGPRVVPATRNGQDVARRGEGRLSDAAPTGFLADPNRIHVENPIAADADLEGGEGDEPLSIATVRAKARKESRMIFCRHFLALFWKRFHNAKRDFKACCLQLLVPIAVIIVGLALLRVGESNDFPSLQMSTADLNIDGPDGQPLENVVPYFTFQAEYPFPAEPDPAIASQLSFFPERNVTQEPLGPDDDAIPSQGQLITTNATGQPANWYQRMSQFLFDTRATRRASKFGAYVAHSELFPAVSESTSQAEYTVFQNTTGRHTVPLFQNLLATTLYRQRIDESGEGNPESHRIIVRNHAMPFTARENLLIGAFITLFAGIQIVIGFAFIPASYIVFVVKEREINAKHQQLISGVSIPAYWFSNYAWDFGTYLFPCFLSIGIIAAYDLEDLLTRDEDRLAATMLLFIFYGASVAPFSYCASYLFKSHSNAQNSIIGFSIFCVLLMLASFIMSFISSTCEIERDLRFLFRIFPAYSLGNGLVALSQLSNWAFLTARCDGLSETAPSSALDWEVTGANITFMAVGSVVFMALAIVIDFIQSHPTALRWLSCDPKIDPPPLKPSEIDEDVAAEERRVQDLRGEGRDDVVILKNIRKCYPGGKYAVRGLSFGVPIGQVFGFLGVNGAGKTTTLKALSGDVIPTSGAARLAGYDIMHEQVQIRRLIGYCPQFDALHELMTVREHLELFAHIKSVPRDQIEQVVRTKIREMDLEEYENVRAGALSGGNRRKLSVAISLIGNPPIVFLDEPSTGMDPVSRRKMWRIITNVATRQKTCSIILTSHSMEETEALCQRVGIMVSGRLRCLGSIQHLKHRHGQGYMAEIRMKPVEESERTKVAATIKQRVIPSQSDSAEPTLNRQQVQQACAVLGHPDWGNRIQKNGSGWRVDASLRTASGVVSVHDFAEWWCEEAHNHTMLDYMMREAFPPLPDGAHVKLVEQHGPKFRLSIPPQPHVALGEMFSRIEEAKDRIGIEDYSLAQTSLEQIFNYFASQQEEEQGVARGMAPLEGDADRAPAAANGDAGSGAVASHRNGGAAQAKGSTR